MRWGDDCRHGVAVLDAGTTRRAARRTAALEGFDDDHPPAAARAWRAMVCRRTGRLIRVVGLGRYIPRRHGRGDQFPGTRDVGVAAGAGEQPVVADPVEALGQGVEQEAPDRQDTQRVLPSDIPPPGTIMWRCGWWVIAEPQLWSTAVAPMRAPRCLGSAAIVSSVSAAVRNSRS